MITCQNCKKEITIEIDDDDHVYCIECGKEIDLHDEEEAKKTLFTFVKELFNEFNTDEEMPILCEVEWMKQKLGFIKPKADHYDTIRSYLQEYMAELFTRPFFVGETDDLRKFKHEILFSMYHEKNQSERIKIYENDNPIIKKEQPMKN